MSPARLARVVLRRNERAYLGVTMIDARGWVHVADAMRCVGDGSFRPVGDRSWPRAEVAEVRWCGGVSRLPHPARAMTTTTTLTDAGRLPALEAA